MAILTGATVTAKAENSAGISDVYLTLNENVVVNFIAKDIPSEYSQAEMKFTYLGNEYVESASVSQGQAIFRFDKVTPQYFTEDVTARLMLGGTQVGETKTFTVKSYCEDLLSYSWSQLGISETKYRAMQTLAVDLLYYGEAAQAYTSVHTDLPATSGLTDEQKAYKSPDAAVEQSDLSYDNTDEQMRWYGYGLRFDYNVALYVKFVLKTTPDQSVSVRFEKAGNTETVAVTEEKTTSGYTVYKAVYTDIAATEFDCAVSAQVLVGEEPVGTPLVYSVRSFVSEFRGTSAGALAQNVYNYGKAAQAYNVAMENLIKPTWQAIRIVPSTKTVEFNRDKANLMLGTEKTAQVDYVRFDLYDLSDKNRTVLGSFKLYAVENNGYISDMNGGNQIALSGALNNLFLSGADKYGAFVTLLNVALGENYVAGKTYALKAQLIAKSGTGYADSETADFNYTNERMFVAIHSLQYVQAVSPTCTTDGNVEYWHCSFCDRYFADAEATREITLEDTVVAARHTTTGQGTDNGNDTKTFICSVCGEPVVKTVVPIAESIFKFHISGSSWVFEYDRIWGNNSGSSLFAENGVDYVKIFVYEGETLAGTFIMDDEDKNGSRQLYFTDMQRSQKVSIGSAANAYQMMAPLDWCKGTLAVFLGEAYKADTAYSFKAQTIAIEGDDYCDSGIISTNVTITSVSIVDLLATPDYRAINIVKGNYIEIDRGNCFLNTLSADELAYIEYSFYLSTDSNRTVLGQIKAYTDGKKGYLSAMDGMNVIPLDGALNNLYCSATPYLTLMEYALGDHYAAGSTYYVKVQLKAAEGSPKGDSQIYDIEYVNNRVFIAQ